MAVMWRQHHKIVRVSRCTVGNLNNYEGELASIDKKNKFCGNRAAVSNVTMDAQNGEGMSLVV